MACDFFDHLCGCCAFYAAVRKIFGEANRTLDLRVSRKLKPEDRCADFALVAAQVWFSCQCFEGLSSVGPRKQLVDGAIGMTIDDPGKDNGLRRLGRPYRYASRI